MQQPVRTLNELQDLVRDHPQRCVGTARVALAIGPLTAPMVHLAWDIGAAYQRETGDDLVARYVDRRLKELGWSGTLPRLLTDDTAPEAPRLIALDIMSEQLRREDAYPIIRHFTYKNVKDIEALRGLASLRGRCVLTFDVPLADPREVWEVPEVRSIIRKIADAVPYFPYFLFHGNNNTAFHVYFGSLAAPTAHLAGGALDLMDQSCLVEVATAIRAVRAFATAVGNDPDQVCAEVMQGIPEQFVEMVTTTVRLSE
jgi:hypothetical protein